MRVVVRQGFYFIVGEVKDIILCDGDFGVGAYGMEWVHNREPRRRRITSLLGISI